MNSIKINFDLWKTLLRQCKDKPQGGHIPNHLVNKEFISKLYKEWLQLNNDNYNPVKTNE